MNQSVITWEELCRQKGELVTQIEIAQGKLQQVNLQMSEILGRPKVEAVKA